MADIIDKSPVACALVDVNYADASWPNVLLCAIDKVGINEGRYIAMRKPEDYFVESSSFFVPQLSNKQRRVVARACMLSGYQLNNSDDVSFFADYLAERFSGIGALSSHMEGAKTSAADSMWALMYNGIYLKVVEEIRQTDGTWGEVFRGAWENILGRLRGRKGGDSDKKPDPFGDFIRGADLTDFDNADMQGRDS